MFLSLNATVVSQATRWWRHASCGYEASRDSTVVTTLHVIVSRQQPWGSDQEVNSDFYCYADLKANRKFTSVDENIGC